jgi:coenzyme F420-0:L-glutamate ligase/coenzyme F420-1:gamma-L-glutamate ligase
MISESTHLSSYKEIRIFGIEGLPEIHPGDDVPALLFALLSSAHFPFMPGDICVVTQKIISKAEGSLVDLRTISPSPFAQNLADRIHKDPRVLEVILRESKRIVRMDRDILICETRHGFICANAGVDQSNIPGDSIVSVLPADPDESARKFRQGLQKYFQMDMPVIITDTFGRPWREGLTNVAVGVAGISPLIDLRGKKDACGYELHKTMIAVADEIASAAELVMKKRGRIPLAILRGYAYPKSEAGSQALLRSPERDLFR